MHYNAQFLLPHYLLLHGERKGNIFIVHFISNFLFPLLSWIYSALTKDSVLFNHAHNVSGWLHFLFWYVTQGLMLYKSFSWEKTLHFISKSRLDRFCHAGYEGNAMKGSSKHREEINEVDTNAMVKLYVVSIQWRHL